MSKVDFKHCCCALQLSMLAHDMVYVLEKCLRFVLKNSGSQGDKVTLLSIEPIELYIAKGFAKVT